MQVKIDRLNPGPNILMEGVSNASSKGTPSVRMGDSAIGQVIPEMVSRGNI